MGFDEKIQKLQNFLINDLLHIFPNMTECIGFANKLIKGIDYGISQHLVFHENGIDKYTIDLTMNVFENINLILHHNIKDTCVYRIYVPTNEMTYKNKNIMCIGGICIYFNEKNNKYHCIVDVCLDNQDELNELN